MNSKKFINKYLLGFTLTIMLSSGSCGGTGKQTQGDSVKADTSPTELPSGTASVKGDTIHTELSSGAENVNAIKVFFDNSGSMGGYVSVNAPKNGKALINAVNAIANDFGKGKFKFSANLCCVEKGQTSAKTGLTYNEFNDMIQKGKIASGSESLLNDIVGRIANEATSNPNELQVLFTDGIISGPAAEIKKNPEYTPNNIERLKSTLRNTLDEKGLSAAIYRFDNAGFDGEYYYYDNSHEKKRDTKTRPLYGVALGSPTVVKEFKNWVESSAATNFKPNRIAYAIEPMPIKSGLTNSVYGIKNNTLQFKYKDIRTKYDGTLVVSLPLTIFADMFEKDYDYQTLADKIIIRLDNVVTSGLVDFKGDVVNINIPIEKLSGSKSVKMKVSIPYSIPDWVNMYSTSNDKTNYSYDKTYMLDKFVSAILEGISGGKTDYLFEQEIELSPKKQ